MKYDYNMKDDIMTVTLNGEMDHHSAKTVRESVDKLIEKEKPLIMRLNCSRINFCDSSGLGFIMGRYKKMMSYGGKLTVLDPSDAVIKILNIAGMDKYVNIEYEQRSMSL